MPYDLDRIRADFPILARQVNGRPLVYLDNGATSQKPHAVIESLVRFYQNSNANIHRGAHGLGSEATAAYEQARGSVERFVGANNGNELVFTRGTTESVNLLAQAWGRANLMAGDEVVLSRSEHHANFVPWYMIAKERGAKLVLLPLDAAGRIDLGSARALITERCKVLAFTWVSNVLGGVNAVGELAALGKAKGAMVFVDAAQAAPHFPLNLAQCGADAAAFSAHKMLGPTGVGVLWAREALLEAMPPWQGGGSMISSVSPELVTWNRLPWKFEAGTPNIADVVAFGAAVKYLKAIGWEALRAHEEALCAYALKKLAGVDGLKLYGPSGPRDRVAVFSFSLAGVDAGDAGALLDAQGIEVRVGNHCAQPLMEELCVPGLIRASAYLYNSPGEIDALVAGLERVVSKLRPAASAAAKA
ncbi:MAG TPA: SufS family cysteine desulfurase [bacterium]|nr:SufS family cysteine desulfurase [bacterium]